MYSWVTTLINSPVQTRKKLKTAVLNGVKYYNANYSKVGENPESSDNLKDQLEGKIHYKINKLDPNVQKFMKDLEKEKGFEFIGFADQVSYIKEKGSADQIEALWEHPFGSAALLYKVKGLPALIITGPDLEFNDSIRNRIKSNKNRSRTYGVTG